MAMRDEFTVLPPAEPLDSGFLGVFREDCEGTQVRLVGPTGEEFALPEEVYEVLHGAVSAMANGNAVAVIPVHQELSAQEAADFLRISHPALTRLLDADEIPFQQVGRHQRLRLIDVLEYRRRRSELRRKTLDEIVEISEEAGLYEITATPTTTR